MADKKEYVRQILKTLASGYLLEGSEIAERFGPRKLRYNKKFEAVSATSIEAASEHVTKRMQDVSRAASFISGDNGVVLRKLDRKKLKARREAVDKGKSKEAEPPFNEVLVDSNKQAANHVAFFAIHENQVWYKLRKGNGLWTMIEGEYSGRLHRISADGCNLVVTERSEDEPHKVIVHYKKVIEETARGDDSVQPRPPYEWKGIFDSDWTDSWFSYPLAAWLVNIFTGKELTFSSHSQGWAISHRGWFVDYWTDADGLNHHNNLVTTLYLLDTTGTSLFLFDPYLPLYVDVGVPVPCYSNAVFEARNIDAAASTLMLVGYETRWTDKDELKTSVQIYTQLFDLDTIGWDPLLKFFIDPLPAPIGGWKQEPCPGDEHTRLSRNIAIWQAGSGNDARELRIQARHNNEHGYFRKGLSEEEWEWVHVHNFVVPKKDYLKPSEHKSQFALQGRNYSGLDKGKKDCRWTLEHWFQDKVISDLHCRDSSGTILHSYKLFRWLGKNHFVFGTTSTDGWKIAIPPNTPPAKKNHWDLVKADIRLDEKKGLVLTTRKNKTNFDIELHLQEVEVLADSHKGKLPKQKEKQVKEDVEVEQVKESGAGKKKSSGSKPSAGTSGEAEKHWAEEVFTGTTEKEKRGASSKKREPSGLVGTTQCCR